MSAEKETSVNKCETDENVASHLSNLKILSRIKANNKLYFKDGQFHIDNAKTQSISRWWTAESRQKTIQELESFIQRLFQTIDSIYNRENNTSGNLISNNYYESSSSEVVFKEANSTVLIQFSNEISNAITGLANLKTTYSKDITTLSSLEIIIEKLSIRMKKIQNILKVINKKDS